MRPSVAWCWAAALLGCGTFEPVDEPGPARVSGCLVGADASPFSQAPVFLVGEDGVARVETRTDARGCFELRTDSGLATLVANDFRGRGLVEPVKLYAHQHLPLGTRTVWSLALEPRVGAMRGVGLAELTTEVQSGASRVTCDLARREVSVAASASVVTLDATTGALRVSAPLVRLSARDPFGSFDVRWADTDTVVQPEGEGWAALQHTARAFTGWAQLPMAGGRYWYVSRSQAFPLEGRPCLLLEDSSCLRVTAAGNGLRVEQWFPDAPMQTRLLPLDGELVAAVPSPDGRWLLGLTNGALEARAWRVRLEQSTTAPESLGVWPGARLQPFEGSATGARDVVHVSLEQAGAAQWARFEVATGAASLVPLPDRGAAELLVPTSPWTGAVLSWFTAEGTGDALRWRVTLAEHLGTDVRLREVVLPARKSPNYNGITSGPLTPWFPGFEFVTGGGLDVFASNDQLFLLTSGAPLSSALRLSTASSGSTPLCQVDRSLVVATDDGNGRRLVVRYDAQRLFEELSRAP